MKHYKLLTLGLAATLTIGCAKTPVEPEPEPEPQPTKETNTVIVYMVADNNLSRYARNNINDMEAAIDTSLNARMLVYYNQSGGYSQLLDIVPDQSSDIVSTVLKDYGDEMNPCTVESVEEVIADCRDLSPSDTYSLIFWSHASGWLPYGMSPARVMPSPDYTFGSTDSFSGALEIYELAEALPDDLVFEYIYFDACHMGNIETAYELKDNAKYLVASPAEILAAGFPYGDAMTELLTNDVEGIAQKYFNYYNELSGVNQSATISVTELEKLDKVAEELKELAKCGENPIATQQYGRYLGSSYNYTDLMWDVEDMATQTYGDAAQPFLDALSEAVIYKAATPYIFLGDAYGSIEITTFSGLSIYIPRLSQPETLSIYTDNYKWAQDTEFYLWAY